MSTLSQFGQYNVFIFVFIAFLSFFIGSLAYTLYYYLHKRHNPNKHAADPRDLALGEAVKIVDTARTKALEMLGAAQSEAKSILQDSENVHSTVKETFDQKMQEIGSRQMQSFEQMSRDLVDSYKAVLSQEKESSLHSIGDISSTLKNELTADMHSFKDRIKALTGDTESHIKNDLDGQYNEISQNLTALKETLKKVTQEAEQGVKNNINGQYDVIQTEITNFANNIRQASEETGTKIKNEMSHEYEGAKEVIHNLSNDLRSVIEETEKELKQGVKAEYDEVRRELADYKKDRYTKIDGVVRGMLEEVARDVLGKTMNAKDHEELIIRSLESIKKTTNLKEL